MMSITIATIDSGITKGTPLGSASLFLAPKIRLFRPSIVRYIECYQRSDDVIICFSVVYVKPMEADQGLAASQDDDNGP